MRDREVEIVCDILRRSVVLTGDSTWSLGDVAREIIRALDDYAKEEIGRTFGGPEHEGLRRILGIQ